MLLPKLAKFLGLESQHRAESLEQLAELISQANLENRILTVLIDEAHKLKSPGSMQEIHSLISMQSLVQFGINFVLFGNPQMIDVVGQTQEFHNRLLLSVHLDDLSLDQMTEYLAYRFKIEPHPGQHNGARYLRASPSN